MRERLMQRANGRAPEDGFTLVELLVAIVILGIIAAIVIVSVSFIGDRGTTASCKTDVQSIQDALQEYYAKQTSGIDYPHAGDPFATLHTDGYLATQVSDKDVDGIGDSGPWIWNRNGYAITYKYVPGTPPQAVVSSACVDAAGASTPGPGDGGNPGGSSAGGGDNPGGGGNPGGGSPGGGNPTGGGNPGGGDPTGGNPGGSNPTGGNPTPTPTSTLVQPTSTSTPTPTPSPTPLYPAPVVNVRVAPGWITLSWTSPSPTVTGYSVGVKIFGITFALGFPKNLGTGTTSLTFPTFKNITYTITVRALYPGNHQSDAVPVAATGK